MSTPTNADILAALAAIATRLDTMQADLAAIARPVPRGELSGAGAATPRPAASRPATGQQSLPGTLPATLPNYGRRKGEPIAGAAVADLEYYAAGCRRTLDDPAKSRWHDKERALLAAIEAEIARQGGAAPTPPPGAPEWGGPADDDIPF